MQARSVHTRNRLVAAGAETFGRDGYAGATLGEIARSAGVTKGALYFHFASKGELADAVQEQACAVLRGHFGEQWLVHRDPVQQLIDLTHWLARTLHEDPLLRAGCRLAGEGGGASPDAADPRRVWTSEVGLLLARAREVGALHPWAVPDGPETLLSVAVFGLGTLAGTGLELPELLRRVTALWALLLPALVPDQDLERYRPQAPTAA